MLVTEEVKKLRKKLAKAERAYEKAEGKPIARARILRAAAAVDHKLDRIRRAQKHLAQMQKGGTPDEESTGDNRDEQTRSKG